MTDGEERRCAPPAQREDSGSRLSVFVLDALMPRHFCLDYGFDGCIFDTGVREGRRGNDAYCGLKLVAVLAGTEHEKGAER